MDGMAEAGSGALGDIDAELLPEGLSIPEQIAVQCFLWKVQKKCGLPTGKVKTVKSNKGTRFIAINNEVLESIRTGSALKKDAQHAFNDIIDNYASVAKKFNLVGGDGVSRSLYQVEGSLNGKKGIFEWIVDPDLLRGVTHRRFIENVEITGKPNARPKR